jgi:uncharacterized protein (DUF305 family)
VKYVTVALVAALALSGCGDDEKEDAGGGPGTDRAFIAAMIPHHESAIEMAAFGSRRGESAFVKTLSRDIASAQHREIATMRDIDARLAREGAKAGSLDVPESERGMDHDPAVLRRADPFDPAFLRMMIAHHEGALAMAREERAKGSDPRLKALATSIVDAQQAEIARMREHLGAGGAGDHHNP